MKIAFIGLGVMGYPMAGHLAKAGHEVCVYNRTLAKSEKWQSEFGGGVADTPAQAVQGAEVVCACVGNDEHLRAVTLGEQGAFSAMAEDFIYIDHTSASAQIARELHTEAATRGFSFLDAPVSGGEVGAQTGQLTIMVGGDADVFARAKPIMDCYAKSVRLMGGPGSGQLTKMVNQICVAGLLEGLAEGLAFAQAAGLDGEAVVDVISKGAAQSWQMENRYKTMLAGEFDFGFAVDWMRKDLKLAMQEASRNGASLPITEIVDRYYQEIQAMGGGRWDTSSLITRLIKGE